MSMCMHVYVQEHVSLEVNVKCLPLLHSTSLCEMGYLTKPGVFDLGL
ncbi:rCG63444 [Rattus norvegicus]|uniref:RCG63444 n=1 Tax=Rattus norvegicus TaxID=10116 RepID=A6HBJ1_RAT|nr:rCG63444 [Rattus norvegicus]